MDSCNSPTDTNNAISSFVLGKFNMFKDFHTLLFAFLCLETKQKKTQWRNATFCLSHFIIHRNRFSFSKTRQVLGPYFTTTQSTKGSPGGMIVCLLLSPFSLLGAAPSALWDWVFFCFFFPPSGENLAPSAELTHSTSRRKAYLNTHRANKRLCSGRVTVGCGPLIHPHCELPLRLWRCGSFISEY